LYQSLSEKIEMPIIKTLFLNISQDSAKHSTLLKGISDSMEPSKKNPKDCKKKLGPIWKATKTFQDEIYSRKKISILEFSQLAEKLTLFESALGEEYFVLVQMKTLQLLEKEINQSYNVDLGHLQKMFESIIRDENHHRALLITIKKLLAENNKLVDKDTLIVKYQNPDAWIHSLPSTY
jgi:rubrerythrin